MPDSLPNIAGTASAPRVPALDRALTVTLFRNHGAAEKFERVASLRDMVAPLRDTRGASKADLPWLKLAAFGDTPTDRGSYRHDANVLAINGVEADYDGERLTFERARQILGNANVAAVLYTSPSHTASAPRWRVLCPTSEALPPSERTRLLARVNGLFLGALAAESFTLSQSYYFGALHGATDHQVVSVDGRAIDLCDDLDAGAVGRPAKPKPEPRPAPPPYVAPALTGEGTPYGLRGLALECEAIRNAQEGMKHHTLNKAAYSIGGLVSAGAVGESLARAELAAALASIRDRCADFHHAEKTLRQAFEDGKNKPRTIPEAPVAPPPRDYFGIGRAREVRHDPETGEILSDPEKPRPDSNLLPLLYFHEIAANLDAADFVEGLLIETAMSVVYGPSNCGKTFFMSDLALHVATGRTWRGKEIEPGGVIYCALEGSHGISNRIAAFKREQGLEGVEIPFAVVPVAINLLDPNADRDRLVETIRAAAEEMGCPVKLVVIDTLSRALAGGNENAPDDMGALVASADYVRQAVKAHICFIHHSGKDQAQGARGHSLLRAATDTEIEISRPDKDSPSVARVTKQRELEIEGHFVFTLRSVELGKNRRGKAVTSCVVEAVDAEAGQQPVRLSAGARATLEALTEALASSGRPSGQRDVPDGALVIPIDLWRQEFYSRSALENHEAKKKAFQRGAKDLLGARVAAIRNDVVWLVR